MKVLTSDGFKEIDESKFVFVVMHGADIPTYLIDMEGNTSRDRSKALEFDTQQAAIDAERAINEIDIGLLHGMWGSSVRCEWRENVE